MAKMASTGRRLLLTICLVLALSIPSSAQLGSLFSSIPSSVPLIVQLSPTASITTITSILNAKVLDSMPDANMYLLSVPLTWPTGSLTGLLGIQWVEINTAIWIPDIAIAGIVNVPGTPVADFYKDQPAWQPI